MEREAEYDVAVIGGGVAGMAAALFTARSELRTVIINEGTSILNRNAHLENYPGFPRGINPRLFLEMFEDQVRESGVEMRQENVRSIKEGNTVSLQLRKQTTTARRLILASWSDLTYLGEGQLDWYEEGSKQFLVRNDDGRTSQPGIYATGRIAGVRHQTVVAAGDGADVGLSVVEDLRPDYYHDWVVPEGYFTGRGRSVPEGCEEISDEERKQRAHRARKSLLEYLEASNQDGPEPHPSQQEN